MRQKSNAALGAALLLLGTACSPAPIVNIPTASQAVDTPTLTVAVPEIPEGTTPSEGEMLAHVYAAALNAAGVKTVVQEAPVANSQAVAALAQGDIDIIPAYSRLVLQALSPESEAAAPSDVGDELASVLPPAVLKLDASKADEHGNIVVTAVTAEKYKLKSITDLAKVCDTLTMGGTKEFQTDPGGLAGLSSDYSCVPKSYKPLQTNLTPGGTGILWELLRDDVQFAEIHSTSPAIADNSLVVLDDPEQLFPTQSVIPLVAGDAVDKSVQDLINKVSAALTTDELSNLNRLAQDRHYGDCAEVAQAWLIQKGMVKASS